MVDFLPQKPVVLIVEDDPHGKSFMESSLLHSGCSVHSVWTAEEAIEVIRDTCPLEQLSAVITDYRLPGISGIELLKWVRSRDATISTVIITGQGEKSIVEKSLAVGVFDYLEKPVTHQVLKKVMTGAIRKTSEQRKIEADKEGLLALENLDQQMNIAVPAGLGQRLSIFYKPLHEVGGDFLLTHDYGNGRYVLVVGDISGHDIRSGFVSTYFQGLFKGSLESSAAIENAFRLSNKSLKSRSKSGGVDQDLISLSVSAIDFGPHDDYVMHWNFGLTPCCTIDKKGRIHTYDRRRWPLGWMDELETDPLSILISDKTLLYIYTDGLSELADFLNLNYFSLLYRFLRKFNAFQDLPVKAKDDILAIRFLLIGQMTVDQTFEPILSEHYAGVEIDHIDHLQSNWRRSLSFVLGDRLGDRLYDLLICIREGMINALTHGCESSPDKFAHLQISINEDLNLLRVFIDDPGKGHNFKLENRVSEIARETGKNLGLGIVQHLSDNFTIDNQGTSLVFDFKITPEK